MRSAPRGRAIIAAVSRPPATPLLLALALAASGCSDGEEACSAEETLCAGECRGAAFFAANPFHCGACGVSCGAGTCAAGACDCGGAATCGDGSCWTEHENGLGQSWSDCEPLDMHTRAQAELAAAAWNPGATAAYPGGCAIGCLCTERVAEAAVWCYLGSGTRAGWAMATPDADCATAICPDRGYGVAWR